MENATSSPSSPVVQARNLTKLFNQQAAVADLDLDLHSGNIFGFIGPSGCGKTTTMRLLLGLLKPTDGSVTVFGKDPIRFTRHDRSRLGYMPQQFILYQTLSIWENLNFAASMYGMSWRRKKRLKAVLELVDLAGHEGKLAKNISGGMQRRVSLATALAHDPELLFLDEPTAGIDPILRQRFWEHFVTLKNLGKSLFVTTQYVGEAAYCDYVGVMSNGRLLHIETPETLRRIAYDGEMIHLTYETPLSWSQRGELAGHPLVRSLKWDDEIYRVLVDDASTALPQLLSWSKDKGLEIQSAIEFTPSFDDVFVKLIEKAQEEN